MNIKIAYNTDKGIKKTTNQDGFIVKGAKTEAGDVLLAVICDGMGGLSKGELASTQVLLTFSDWFEQVLPELLQQDLAEEVLFESLHSLLEIENKKLAEYGVKNNISLGTTATAFLIVGMKYYSIHIGDSRIYKLTDNLYQLTADHTVVAREIAAGRLTKEQAAADPRRNMLLQCIGASQVIEPACQSGLIEENACYLLCSDGFRHMITQEEIYSQLNPYAAQDEQSMQSGLLGLTETVKARKETDNITALLIHT